MVALTRRSLRTEAAMALDTRAGFTTLSFGLDEPQPDRAAMTAMTAAAISSLPNSQGREARVELAQHVGTGL
jgi:hypothetical protein